MQGKATYPTDKFRIFDCEVMADLKTNPMDMSGVLTEKHDRDYGVKRSIAFIWTLEGHFVVTSEEDHSRVVGIDSFLDDPSILAKDKVELLQMSKPEDLDEDTLKLLKIMTHPNQFRLSNLHDERGTTRITDWLVLKNV
jgi:hypothetical protein